MWISSPYLISGIVAVANARAIPIANGLVEKRQIGSINSQSSSSSSGFSTSSQTTSDGRVSRTTVYGGTPYTITQSSQSSPAMGQGASVSSIQLGQNLPQLIQNTFPTLSTPFQTGQFSNRPLQSIGMPALPPAISIPPLGMPLAMPIPSASMSIPSLSIPIPYFPTDPLGIPTQAATFVQNSPATAPNPNLTPATSNATPVVSSLPKLTKAVTPDPTVTETANHPARPANQLLGNSNLSSDPSPPPSPPSAPPSTDPTQGLSSLSRPLDLTKPNATVIVPPSAPKPNTANANPVRHFPVLGLPVAPNAQGQISPNSTTENSRPEGTKGTPQHNNQHMQPNSLPKNNLTVQAPTVPQTQTQTQVQTPPKNTPPTMAPGIATGNAPVNDTRLETDTIPIILESFTLDGLPSRSEGLLKISNITPTA